MFQEGKDANKGEREHKEREPHAECYEALLGRRVPPIESCLMSHVRVRVLNGRR